jgi:uncharacterized protein (DUF302 family)
MCECDTSASVTVALTRAGISGLPRIGSSAIVCHVPLPGRHSERSAMRYAVKSAKSVEQATSDLEAAVRQQGFGVLHQYDLKQTLAGKGVELPHECRILEVCNPKQAARVLEADMAMNIALPCRISVYEDGGQTWIGMARPTALLAGLSDSPQLHKVAEEVEQATIRMIEAAK